MSFSKHALTRTSDRAQTFVHRSGTVVIAPEYIDPVTHTPVHIGGCILAAGAHHAHGLYADTVVMTETSFRNYITHCTARGTQPTLPYTDQPIYVACRVNHKGTYTNDEVRAPTPS